MSTYRVVPLSSLSAPEAPLRLAIERGSLEELARSIQTVGLLQPITVKEAPAGYEVVAGHRRLLACRMIGLGEVAVMIRADDERGEAAVMLVENIQRADLSPIEEARALAKGRDVLGLTVDELATRASRSEAWVRGRLDLLTWPIQAIEAVGAGEISVAALRPLMEIEDAKERDRLIACAIEGGASANVTRIWAQQARGYASNPPEGLGTRDSMMVGIGDVVVSMPCFSCREKRDAMSLQIVRICRPCISELEAAALRGGVEAGNGAPAS
jgi:ParB/RepB/Spo0J family partition protein